MTEAPPAVSNAQWQSNLVWGSAPAEEKVDVREIWRKLWRGRRLIALTTIAGSLLGFAVIQQLTPRYTATSSVMLETRQRQVVETEAVLAGLPIDEVTIEGEVEVLHSRELARQVANKLDLRENPEFNQELATDEDESPLAALSEYWPSALTAYARGFLDNLASEDAETSELAATDQLGEDIVDAFLDKLEASEVGQSPVIEISFTSESPVTAAKAANTIAETYISAQLESKYEATRQANSWLQARIQELRTEVEAKERAIAEFRARSGLLEGKDVNVAKQQMSELATQLVTARVERQRAESELEQAEQLLESPNGPAAAADVLRSPLIQNLRMQQVQLRRELAALSAEYGRNHPTIRSKQANLRDIEDSIRSEINKIVVGLRNRAQAARQREADLEASLEQLSERVGQLNTQEVELRDLEREVEASRQLLKNYLVRAQETAQQKEIQQPDAEIISLAAVPEDPSFPKKRLFMLLAFCGSAFAGVSIAYGLQAFDRSFHTSGEVRDALGMPVLEIIPSVRRPIRRTSPIEFVTQQPTSSYSEALRTLYVTLLGTGDPPKIVLFTSSVPEEGKTSLTLSFGRFVALAHRSVVVVDCDLRRSSVHRSLGGHRMPGLVDHLLGKASLDEIIQTDEATGLHYIASGPPTTNPTDLFDSATMHNALSRLARRYDLVLLDSAPVLAVADTRCLYPLVDRTVFVVRWRSTQRNAAREAIRRLEESGFDVAGAVLNMVNLKSYHQYDDGYYYDAVKSYYNE